MEVDLHPQRVYYLLPLGSVEHKPARTKVPNFGQLCTQYFDLHLESIPLRDLEPDYDMGFDNGFEGGMLLCSN